MTRITWDRVWLDIASVIGKRSQCSRADIGCVLVSSSNQALSIAYVGAPPEFSPANDADDCSQWCPRSSKESTELGSGYEDCFSVHAEVNAVARVDSSALVGGTAYVSSSCCFNCSKMLAAARVDRVVMNLSTRELHRNPAKSIQYLLDSGIGVRVYFENDGFDPVEMDDHEALELVRGFQSL